jgi:hypothetical protein
LIAPPSGEGKKSTLKAELKVQGIAIQVRHGDMTTEEVDAIVNAANSSLDHACMIELLYCFLLCFSWACGCYCKERVSTGVTFVIDPLLEVKVFNKRVTFG